MTNNFNGESKRLRKAVNELVALNNIANAINALMSVEEITRVIVDHCLKRIKAAQGAVFLLQPEEDREDRFRTFVRGFSRKDDEIPLHINAALSGWMIKNKAVLLSNDPETDKRLKGIDFARVGIYSIISTPLMTQNGLIGSLVLFNKKEADGFNNDDKRFLGIVGTQTARVIENARLREREKKLADLEEDLRAARLIQKGFLPAGDFHFMSFETSGFNIPAKDVGGDYFDIVPLDDDNVFLSLGDVSGKGLPAVFMMASAQSALRLPLQANQEIDLPGMAEALNRLICQFSNPEQFITALFGIYDGKDRSFRYINAGHEPPILFHRDGRANILTESDLLIGVLPDFKYTERHVTLAPGETIVIYSDGVTEAFNEQGDDYGLERLLKLPCDFATMSATAISATIISQIEAFRGKEAQTDDITALILRLYESQK